MHYPTITSDATSILTAILGDGQEVYKAVATDLDSDDQITFSLRDPTATAATEAVSEGTAEVEAAADADPAANAAGDEAEAAATSEDDALFAIDPTSGSVTVKDAKVFMQRTEPSQIIVVATDTRGLSSEKTVSLIYRGVVPGQ
jgi:hypothetical protein